MQFKRLEKSSGSVIGKRRKGEGEQSQESTNHREAMESRARRSLLFDQNIRTKYEETPNLDIYAEPL